MSTGLRGADDARHLRRVLLEGRARVDDAESQSGPGRSGGEVFDLGLGEVDPDHRHGQPVEEREGGQCVGAVRPDDRGSAVEPGPNRPVAREHRLGARALGGPDDELRFGEEER